ncbi:MAG: hypothetical protein H8E53_02760 [Planctomycetes bacterium]|nr:hypothetical protein [Planctomycetota bacterium]
MSKTLQSADAPRYSRQWWLDSARIAFWVIIVTVLVWVYADMEFTKTDGVAMTIRLNTAGSPDIVVTSKLTAEVTFQLRGSRSDLDRFARKFRGRTVDFDLSTLPDFHAGLKQGIPSVLVLESVTELKEWGLSVKSSSPAIISGINIEKIEPRELPVEFIFKGAELAEPLKATVEVLAPASHWEGMGRNPRIRTVEKDLTNLPAGEEQKVKFQLISTLAGKSVKLKNDAVTVNLRVVRKTGAATETIQTTVKIITPAEWTETGVWAKYKLVRREPIEWRTKITVTGPRKDIDILKTDKTQNVDTYVVLTDSDTEPIESWSSRKVTLRFPPGLQIQLASGQIEPTVQFRLEKRVTTTP